MPPIAPTGWKDWLTCVSGNPAGCMGAAGDAKSGAAGAGKAIANSAFKDMVKSFLHSLVWTLEKLSTFWMKVPDPKVSTVGANGGGVENATYVGPINHVIGSITPWAAGLAVLVILLQCCMAVAKMSHEPFVGIVRQVAAIIIVQGSLAAVVQLALQASNAFSKEILTLPGLSDKGLAGLLTVSAAMGQNALGLWLMLAIVGILGSLMQLVFMMFRGPLIILLVVATHVSAAIAANDAGTQRLRRCSGLLLSFVLYKPVAAVIYATGFMLIYGVDTKDGVKGKDVLMNTLYGFIVIIIAALALPAVIKFVDPIAGSTGSSLFSGAVLGGAIAGGAAIAATGGAAAAGGAAAGTAGGTGTAASAVATGGPPGGTGTGGTGGGGAGDGGGSAPGGGGGGGTAAGSIPQDGGAGGGLKNGGSNDPAGSSGGQSGTDSGQPDAPGGPGPGGSTPQDGGAAGGVKAGGSNAAPSERAASPTGGQPAEGAPSSSDGPAPAGGARSGETGGRQLPVWANAARGAGRGGRRTQEAADEALSAEGASL